VPAVGADLTTIAAPPDREHGGSERWTAQRAVKGVGEQRDEDRCSKGENGNLVAF